MLYIWPVALILTLACDDAIPGIQLGPDYPSHSSSLKITLHHYNRAWLADWIEE
jgi:hypothetical protein